MTDPHGTRPTRPQSRRELGDWTARSFASSVSLAVPPPAELTLDDEVADDPLADRDAARAHLAALRADGLL